MRRGCCLPGPCFCQVRLNFSQEEERVFLHLSLLFLPVKNKFHKHWNASWHHDVWLYIQWFYIYKLWALCLEATAGSTGCWRFWFGNNTNERAKMACLLPVTEKNVYVYIQYICLLLIHSLLSSGQKLPHAALNALMRTRILLVGLPDLKYLKSYWADCLKIFYTHSWSPEDKDYWLCHANLLN